MTNNELIETDALILGCGIAGITAALRLAEAGLNIIVATPTEAAEESNTLYAQGGIVFSGSEDSPEQLTTDIMKAGAGLCNIEAVKLLAREGPALVKEVLIEKAQVTFNRNQRGEFSFVQEGGHSLHRILHVEDATGLAVEQRMLSLLLTYANVRILTSHTAIDLLTPAHHSLNRTEIYNPLSCAGAFLFDKKSKRVLRCLASQTILATGGLGQLFLRTTNPDIARGDGLAMAYRAGARVVNCEFVQFHPTAFFQKNAPVFLVSEALRGAGAQLLNHSGERFMNRYDPVWKDLAPRDVAARSILREMHNTNADHVYLDIASVLKPTQIQQEFPSAYRQCLQYGIDITQDFIPVLPAAHYFCGGVAVDMYGRTTIEHLYAIGEVSCTGVHGANRLASVSLLEGIVWGDRSAKHILAAKQIRRNSYRDHILPWNETGTEEPDSALIEQDMNAIKHIMWNYVGLIRTAPRLQRAIRELRYLETEIEQFYRSVQVNDNLIGLRNMVCSANIIAAAAWQNNCSVGCHFRE